MTTSPKATTPHSKDRPPTREQLDEDMSIDADFDTVLDRIMSGKGTDDGNHSV